MIQPQPSRSATAAKTVAQPVTAPDFVQVAKKKDETVLAAIEKNPIYNFIIEGDIPKEKRIANVLSYLMAGVQEGTVKVDELDERKKALTEFNAFVQIVRKQLGAQQTQEITNRAYADFQRIVNDTTEDVARFQEELAPLGKLAEIFTNFGTQGNIIEKINVAKSQQKARLRNHSLWELNHTSQISRLQSLIDADREELKEKWFGWGKNLIQTRIEENTTKLNEFLAETPPVEEAPANEIQVDEGILELQNIGGKAFKEKVSTLRDHTEEALAKISANFDEAIEGLSNTRSAFTQMDRNCGDANFALSVLQTGVQQAEAKTREIAESITKETSATDAQLAELERMERERKSSMLLSYTGSLTTFLKDVGIAVASLRSGQAVIKNILRMNQLALESANTHKITGIANTADAVTIVIGSIIDVCNRAASQALADGLSSMRQMSEEGTQRLAAGTYDSLQMQNAQLESFIDSVTLLKDTTRDITANSVDLLKEQFAMVQKMREESAALAESTVEAERTSFAARAGVIDSSKPDDKKPDAPHKVTGLRVGEHS